MDPEFWERRWVEGQIGFHQPAVHADLLAYGDRVVDGTAVLVPLCGKTRDLGWLAERTPTIGVELSALAVEQLWAESGVEPTCEVLSAGTDRTIVRTHAGRLQVLQADVFDVGPQHFAVRPDRCWDRAALVALTSEQRQAYVAHLLTLLAPQARILLNAFTYDRAVMDGPPHCVDEAEVRSLYRGADIQLLDEREELNERFAAMGHRWWRTTVYEISLP